ncbi:hypothetical protein [Streptosporangium pseudovulgare]|uniref:Secreted protein n=1 Tax=Streptosporangium pseudovulgare TaxID=35765 RepID=A0ABQ2QUV4_9ACTN|nr:hypothetical protein [Streptosporangium pseudovulgare]GGP94734.1 hypothetical protein GCM10010140_25720 [Streptosporangium pseudovulgare]
MSFARRITVGAALAAVAVLGVAVPAYAGPWVKVGSGYSWLPDCEEQGRNMVHYQSELYSAYNCTRAVDGYQLWVQLR